MLCCSPASTQTQTAGSSEAGQAFTLEAFTVQAFTLQAFTVQAFSLQLLMVAPQLNHSHCADLQDTGVLSRPVPTACITDCINGLVEVFSQKMLFEGSEMLNLA